MATTTTSVVTTPLTEYYDRATLRRALQKNVHGIAAVEKYIPLGNSKTYKVRRFESQASLTTPLSEGISPTSLTPSITDLTCSISQYGGYYEVTDMVDWTIADATLTELSKVLGECAANTRDTILRNIYVAGTNVRYSNGVAGRANIVTKIQQSDLDVAIRFLQSANADTITEVSKAGTGIGTQPVQEGFVAVIHPYVWYDLRNSVTGVIAVSQYGNMSNLLPGEVGAYKDIRFVSTSNARIWVDSGGAVGATGLKSTSAVSVDVYATLIFAKDAVTAVSLKGKALQNIRKPFGSAGSGDPLDQRATIGFKMNVAGMILNENFLYRIESGATA